MEHRETAHEGSTAAEIVRRVRAEKPLVQCITNYVAMNFAANAVIAAGAAPAMVHTAEEAGDFARIASALTINMGTLSPPWIEGSRVAATAAREAGVPWVLDPVAVGATPFRNQTAAALLDLKPDAVRGNASEIIALSGRQGAGRGVDAGDSVVAAEDAARRLAAERGCVVAVTGPIDFVTDGTRATRIRGGHPTMPMVTAMGCALTAVSGAFLACTEDRMAGMVAALVLFAYAGQVAGARAQGPGTFLPAFLDALAAATDEDILRYARIEIA